MLLYDSKTWWAQVCHDRYRAVDNALVNVLQSARDIFARLRQILAPTIFEMQIREISNGKLF